MHKNEATIQAIGGVPLVRGSVFATIGQTIGDQANSIRLIETSGRTAVGRVLNGRVVSGDKLVETFHFVPVSKLRLAVSGDSVLAAEIGRNLSALDFVQVVNPSEFRDVEFEETMNSNSLCITPYRNQHRLPDIEVGDMGSTLARTRLLLENLFAVKLLVNLKNPNPSFSVDVRVNGKDNDEVRIGRRSGSRSGSSVTLTSTW